MCEHDEARVVGRFGKRGKQALCHCIESLLRGRERIDARADAVAEQHSHTITRQSKRLLTQRSETVAHHAYARQ